MARKRGNQSKHLFLTFHIVSPQYFMVFLWELILNLDLLVHLVECQNCRPLIYIYIWGDFVYHHWGCPFIALDSEYGEKRDILKLVLQPWDLKG